MIPNTRHRCSINPKSTYEKSSYVNNFQIVHLHDQSFESFQPLLTLWKSFLHFLLMHFSFYRPASTTPNIGSAWQLPDNIWQQNQNWRLLFSNCDSIKWPRATIICLYLVLLHLVRTTLNEIYANKYNVCMCSAHHHSTVYRAVIHDIADHVDGKWMLNEFWENKLIIKIGCVF